MCSKGVYCRVLGWLDVSHGDKVGESCVYVEGGGLRRMGSGGKYVVKGHEIWLWRSVDLAIRAPGDSYARDIGRQMTRSPLWQRSVRKLVLLPRVVVVVVQVLGKDG